MEDFITAEDLIISGEDLAQNLRLTAVPTLLFFDDAGKINYVASGYFDVSKLDTYVESAFYGYGEDKIKLYDYLEEQ